MSEVMLQQTQVARVLPAYARFVRRFPTLRSLARATLADVLREWAGLGYNRRARDLHRIARSSARGLPRTVAGLDALPGVGRYTAAAVACFAHAATSAFADTNIRRVLGRAFLGRTASEREARELDDRVMSRRDPAGWHHALMDIGATVCVARRPRCASCPLRGVCTYTGAEEFAPRRQSPFATSDRRVRGAILGVLRNTPFGLGLPALSAAVGDDRVERLVLALEREGLVEVSDEGVRLPTS